MSKKSKITLAALSALLLAAVVLILVTLFGKDTTVFGEYNYDSSLRWYETVEDIVIDGKKDDDSWKNINPYIRETKKENRDSVKYKGMESKIQECEAEVYTYLGEEGLFLYATTDDPVVNTTALSPFVTTAFDFYISDQEALSRLGSLVNVAITAEGNVKIRVRDKDAITGKEAWVSQPCIGVKAESVIGKKGYSIEMYIPWSTLKIEDKPEYIQLATALSRRIDETEASERFWEMFDYYTAPIGFINSSTYPLFDKTGYVEFAEGENFASVHSNIIDLSKDKGENPQVTTLNRNTVTAFMDEEPVKDVYWETTVQINDFNYTDDPRVGIVLQGEEREDGTYDRVYLLFQLDKKHEGEGYTIKNVIMLPHSNGKNNWEDAQTFNLNSHIKNEEFKMVVMKQNGKFSFYLDDVLLCERTGIENFTADTKVTCGITSWFVGATFTDYSMETSNLNAIKTKKTAGFVADEHYTAIEFDMLTQPKGYIWSYTKSTNQSLVNFNRSVSGTFNATTTISDLTSYKEAKDSRQGIVLTKDLGSAGYRRIFVMLTGGKNNNFNKLQILAINNDNFGDNWNGVTWIADTSIGECKKAELSVSSVNNKVSVYIDGKYITGFSLKDYNMQNPSNVGLSSWKGTAKFSNYSLVSQGKDTSTVTTDVNVVKSILQLNDTASVDIYAETLIKVVDTSTAMWPRAGLRITNKAGENIDFILAYDKKGNLLNVVAVPVDKNGSDSGKQQTYYIDSVLEDASKEGIKLAVAKVGDTFYFYVNDVLIGTKTYEGFGANDEVTASLYSKATTSTFSNYSAKTDRAEINATTAKLTDIFVADTKKNTIRFDILSEADGKVTTNENGTWKDSSIVNWYGVSDTKFYAETTVKLEESHATGSANGMVLTSGDNRFFILLSGDEKGITSISCYSMNRDVMDNYNAEKYPNGKVTEYTAKVNLETENKLAVHRDGNQLVIFLNGKVQTIVDLSAVKYPITDASMVGLTAWKAQSTFTDYSIKSGAETPALVVKDSALFTKENLASWNWESEYDTKGNTISVEFSESDVTKATQVLTLNETAVTELYAETIVTTSKTSAGMWPRVGLRLTNSDGTNVDYIVAYAKNETPTYVELFATQTDATGADISGTKQIYAITSIKDSVAKEGVKLAVAKKGDTLYFYVNDVLQGTKIYEGFGAEATVTAKLYSKGTESSFSDYVITADVDVSMEALTDIFVADTNKSTIYFDLLKEAEGTVTTNETGSWKGSSIVNWNGIFDTKFYAETTVKLEESHTTGSANGMVLTSGDNRFFILLSGDEKGITSICCYSMNGDVMDNYNAEKYPNGKVTEYTAKVNLETENKLAVHRDGNQLVIFLNDKVQTIVDLSAVKYPITDASMVGLTAWKAQSTFTDYSIKSGAETPALVIADNLPFTKENLEKWNWNSRFDVDNNMIIFEIGNSNSSTPEQTLMLNESVTGDFYAETTIKTSSVAKRYSQVGLRLTNTDNANVDCVLVYNNQGEVDLIEFKYDDITFKVNDADLKANVKATGNGVKVAVARKGDTLYFYVNDVLHGTKNHTGFGSGDAVSVNLYSNYTESSFSDYKVVTTGIDDILNTKADTFVGDSKKKINYFELLNEETESPAIVSYDNTHTTTYGSIVNWNVEATTKLYAETTITINEATQVWAGGGIVITSGNSRLIVTVADNGNVNYISMANEDFSNQNKQEVTIGKVTFADTNNKQAKLAIYRDGVQLTVMINNSVLKTLDLTDVKYPIKDASTVGLFGMRSQVTYTNYSLKTGDACPTLGETTSIVGNAHAQLNAANTVEVTDNVINTKVQMSGKGYLYFPEKSTVSYAETYMNFASGTAGRAGIALSNGGNGLLKMYLYASATSANVTNLQIYSSSTSSTASWGDKESENLDIKLSDIEGLGSIGRENVKLSVLRVGDSYTIYINNIQAYSGKLSDRSSFGISAETETYIGFFQERGAVTYYKFACPPIDETITLAASAFAKKDAVNTLAISNNVASTKIELNSATSSSHKYLYFKEKSTKVYAETYIDFTTATSDQRIGIALTDADKSIQLGIYLLAKNGTSGVTKLQIYGLNGFASGWGTPATDTDLTKIAGLENIGRKNIKLSVLRDGDNYTVYVNDIKAFEGTLSAISGFNMSATTETHIGLIGMQTSATFSDFTYSYGDAVNAN